MTIEKIKTYKDILENLRDDLREALDRADWAVEWLAEYEALKWETIQQDVREEELNERKREIGSDE